MTRPEASAAVRGPSRRDTAIAALALAAIVIGGVLHLTGYAGPAGTVWAAAIVLALIPLTWEVASSLRTGDVGVDVIALLAMAGALAMGEELAGAVVALMLSGGNALEASAGRRARSELRTLLERAPSVAHRRRGDTLEEVLVDALEIGDIVVVRAGEVVPVDGVVAAAEAVLDESTLTGESLPVVRGAGERARSGAANAGSPFDLRVTRRAADSTYSALVRVVAAAESEKPRFVRMADRYAWFFLPVTLLLASGAWIASGDSVRALAVLVVATPCPLILAAPIALISGMSRAARAGVIVKGGTPIEKLAGARTVLLDKTGTLTLGTPELEQIRPLGQFGEDELLGLAASVDQLSAHVLAEALVAAAGRRQVALTFPAEVNEAPGEGIEGTVGGRLVAVGSTTWLRRCGVTVDDATADRLEAGVQAGRARILVGVDGALAGALIMGDRVRDDAHALTSALHDVGVRRVAMVTGDRADIAQSVAASVGITEVYADRSPEGKLDIVREIQATPGGSPVVMVGDGVNDAPALALADIGIAMGAAGTTVSSETADAVIVVNRIDRIADAVRLSSRALSIARQSVLAGMGLSIAGMIVAALGHLPPVAGALAQEVIDVAVILNALRALR